jgi:putative oxidoreductase
MDTGLLVLRVVVGLLLVGHGAQKLFGWFGGGGLTATAWFFRSLGYWPPRFMARFAGGAELVGGAAVTVGLGTWLAAAAVIATMLNATVAVHKRHGLWAIDGGYEYPLVMAAVAATLGFTGAGAASLDATFGLGDGSVESGLFAMALGLVAGFGVLISRAAARSEAGPTSESSPIGKVAAWRGANLHAVKPGTWLRARRRASRVAAGSEPGRSLTRRGGGLVLSRDRKGQ